MFCKHKWELISEHTTKSILELVAENLIKVRITNHTDVIDMSDRKFIQILTCGKCGKLKRYVERI